MIYHVLLFIAGLLYDDQSWSWPSNAPVPNPFGKYPLQMKEPVLSPTHPVVPALSDGGLTPQPETADVSQMVRMPILI